MSLSVQEAKQRIDEVRQTQERYRAEAADRIRTNALGSLSAMNKTTNDLLEDLVQLPEVTAEFYSECTALFEAFQTRVMSLLVLPGDDESEDD